MRSPLGTTRFGTFPQGLVRDGRRFSQAFLCALIVASATLAASSKLVAANPVLSIGTVYAKPGQTVNTSVLYTPNGAEVSAFQFDLHYDRNTLTGISATLGPAATLAGKMLASAVLSNGDIRYLVYGLNQTVIGHGTVVVLTITVATDAAPGTYALQMLNAVASDPKGNEVPINVSSGQVVVRKK